MVEMATGRKIPIWRTFVFPKPKVAENFDISTKFGLQIDFGFWKSVISLDTKQEVVVRRRGCHLENR